MDELVSEWSALLNSNTNNSYAGSNSKVVADPALEELLNNGPNSTEIKVKERSGLARFFIVEITYMLFFFSDLPLHLVLQKYIIEWTTDDFIKRDLALNKTHHLNKSMTPCDFNITDSDYNFQQDIESRASQITAIQSVVRGVPAIFSTILIGTASDRLGRRYAIIPPCLGLLIYSVAQLIIIMNHFPVWYIFIADFFYGSMGLLEGMGMGCSAYIADHTTNERLSIRLGILSACALVPTIISTQIVGFLVSHIGYWKSVLIAVVILLTNLTYVAIFLREPAHNVSVDMARGSLLDGVRTQVKSMAGVVFNRNLETSSGTTGFNHLSGRYKSARFNLLLLALFFVAIAQSNSSLVVYFTTNYPLCWGLTFIGIYSGLSIASSAVGSVAVLPLQKRCLSDNTIAIMATLSYVVACVYKFFVRTTLMMFLVPIFGCFGFQVHACLKSLLSTVAGKHRQGAVFGVMSSVEVICNMLGVVIFNTVYSHTVYIATGFVFLVAALVYSLAVILLIVHFAVHKKEKTVRLDVAVQGHEEESS